MFEKTQVGGILQITCQCKDQYVGITKRNLNET